MEERSVGLINAIGNDVELSQKIVAGKSIDKFPSTFLDRSKWAEAFTPAVKVEERSELDNCKSV